MADQQVFTVADFTKQFHQVAEKYNLTEDAAIVYIPSHVERSIVLQQELGTCLYIIVGENSRVVIEQMQWRNECNRMFIHLEKGATFSCKQDNQYTREVVRSEIVCYAQQESMFNMYGRYVHTVDMQVTIFLQGSRAQADISLAVRTDHDMQTKFDTKQIHQAPDTKSSLKLKGLLQGQSCSTHLGMIHIEPAAKGSQADLNSRYILMGEHAQAYALPSLEALTHEVQCSHGSAIGRFDVEQVYYLMTRGLSDVQAMELMVDAFFM